MQNYLAFIDDAGRCIIDGKSKSNTILSIIRMNYLNLIQSKTCSIRMKLDL